LGTFDGITPRFARIVVVDEPYHVTHRGNRRADVFSTPRDREVYLAMLAEACRRWQLDVRAYCLMTNHVHFVAVPRVSARGFPVKQKQSSPARGDA
jgi:putative transposase